MLNTRYSSGTPMCATIALGSLFIDQLWSQCLDWLAVNRHHLHPFRQPDPSVAESRLSVLAELALICHAQCQHEMIQATDALTPYIDLIETVCWDPNLLPMLHENPRTLEDILLLLRSLARLGRPVPPYRQYMQAYLDYGHALTTERPPYSRMLLHALLDDLAFIHPLPPLEVIAQHGIVAFNPPLSLLQFGDMFNLYRTALSIAIAQENGCPLSRDMQDKHIQTTQMLLKMTLRSIQATQIALLLTAAALCAPVPEQIAYATWQRLETLITQYPPDSIASQTTNVSPTAEHFETVAHSYLALMHAASRTTHRRSCPCQ